jgi:valyl-tRNA synthetase
MCGFETLLLPGADHAAIATEVKVTEMLAKQGIKKNDITREEFMKHIEVWYEKYTTEICDQFKRLGLSCDWTRFQFTMNDHNKEEVVKAFRKLHDGGYIYKGDRMINWCPSCKTALSDAEVEYRQFTRPIWTIKYGEEISVATTRPETIFGDTAVAVNPDDKRYAHLIGKTVPLPLTDRKIPVIADSSVDMKFGTGAVKVTPAHDHADNEMGQRHNLPAPKVIDENGILFGELVGKYAGLSIMDARKAVAADLEAAGSIVKVKQTESSIGECYRCHNIVEPAISKQWFVKMQELAKPAIDVLNNGLTILPKKFQKIYLHWLNNIRDWCISRQLLSGHKIPIEGETDVLDTWFSSALWPFSTLNGNGEDFRYFYPTQTLVTGYDLIFFWIIRMVFSGIYHTGKLPFETVLLHGLVRDSKGKKMSKSLGNGIDPIEVIEQFGADVLRFSLISGSKLDRDPWYGMERAIKARNFVNKIWNAVKFYKNFTAFSCDAESVASNATKFCEKAGFTADEIDGNNTAPRADSDRRNLIKILETFLKLINPIMPFITQEIWEIMGHTNQIAFEKFPAPEKDNLPELNKIIKTTARRYERFEFGIAANELQQFFWGWFCDEYIERLKPKKAKEKAAEAENRDEKIAFYKQEIARCEKLLTNKGFTAKAPKSLIKQETEKLNKFKQLLRGAIDG